MRIVSWTVAVGVAFASLAGAGTDGWINVRKGRALLEAGRYAEAAAAFDAALAASLAPEEAGPVRASAIQAYCRAGLTDAALALLHREVGGLSTLDEKLALYYEAARALSRYQGRFDLARSVLEEGRSLGVPSDYALGYDLRLEYAVCLLRTGDAEGAAQELAAMLEAYPEPGARVAVGRMLADAYWELGRRQDALAVLDEVIGQVGGEAGVVALRLRAADLCLEIGEAAAALEHAEEALEAAGGVPVPAAELRAAVAKEKLGRVDEAVADYEEIRARYWGGAEASMADLRLSALGR